MRSGCWSSACAIPTLPWPKIPKQPPKKRLRTPSRSTYCAARKRINACAAVSLTVLMARLYDAEHAMSKLLVHSHAADADGCVLRVTPDSAGGRWVGFGASRLSDGVRLARSWPDRETCVVVIAGRVDATAGGRTWRGAGDRATVFDGAPTALYVP